MVCVCFENLLFLLARCDLYRVLGAKGVRCVLLPRRKRLFSLYKGKRKVWYCIRKRRGGGDKLPAVVPSSLPKAAAMLIVGRGNFSERIVFIPSLFQDSLERSGV